MRHIGLVVCVVFVFSLTKTFGQGTLRGDFMMNVNFYDNDPRLGQFGTNTTQYKRELSSAEAWLFLNYNVKGFDFRVRYDMFHNSALLNPQEAFTAQGVPFFSARKSIDDLEITVGSFYDQFGSGILFRAYEDRVIGLDFAMQGIRLKYKISDNLSVRGFTGKQKYRFDRQPEVVQGFNLEGGKFWEKLGLTYGVSAIKRTLDEQQDIQNMATLINSYDLEDRFIPKYNVYGGQFYSSLTYKKWIFDIDLAAKSKEAIFNHVQKLVNRPGFYSMASLSYTSSKFGWLVQGKYSENFSIRTSPFTSLNPIIEGTVGYLAPVNRQNTYRLPARYSPAVQELGEIGLQADFNYTPNRNNKFNVNVSYIEQPNAFKEKLFQELFVTYQKKFSKKVKATFGYQNLFYNMKVYQGKPEGTPNVIANTPFVEVLYKIKRKLAIRTEAHYMRTDQDLGDFAFVLTEITVAPKYSFTISDMVNTKPREDTRNPNVAPGELVHYPTFYFAFTHQQTRVSAGYIKQVEGVVCTGGVCRVEPAFSGVRFTLTTNF